MKKRNASAIAPLVLAAIAACTHARHARAQYAGSAADKAAAEALFDQGKKLLAEGKFGEACPKFAESNRLDAGIGTMLYLAECYEKNGQTASAWAQFREAASAAAQKNDPRERVARDRASRLEPKLSKMTIAVSAAETSGLEVRRDGELLGRALWGAEFPVDPGSHVIAASAPGKKPWQTTVRVAAEARGPIAVSVPALEDAPLAAAPAPSPRSSSAGAHAEAAPIVASAVAGADAGTNGSRGSGQRVAGLVVGGVGIVGLGLGAFFGLQAKSHLDDSNADGHCHDGNKCDAIGVQARSDAQSAATISTIAFAAGAVAVAGGLVLYLTAPKGASHVAIAPSLSPREPGLVLRGAF